MAPVSGIAEQPEFRRAARPQRSPDSLASSTPCQARTDLLPPSPVNPARSSCVLVYSALSSRLLPTSGNMAVQIARSLCRCVSLAFPCAKIPLSRASCAQMKGYPDRIQSCTTTHFEGAIAVIDPDSSWVARWQRTCTCFLVVSSILFY